MKSSPMMLVALVVLLVAGCGGGRGEPSPTPSATPLRYAASLGLAIAPVDAESAQGAMAELEDAVRARLAAFGAPGATVARSGANAPGFVLVNVPEESANDLLATALEPRGQIQLVALLGSSYGSADQPGGASATLDSALPNSDFFPLLERSEISSAGRRLAGSETFLQVTVDAIARRNIDAYVAAHGRDFWALTLDGRVVATGVLEIDLHRASDTVTLPIDALDRARLLVVYLSSLVYPFEVSVARL